MTQSAKPASRLGRLLRRTTMLVGTAGLVAGATGTVAQVPPTASAPAPAAPAATASTSAAKVQRPNVILILADDLGVETINAYGGEYYTPRIDALARSGVTFLNAHATPLCTPSRVRLMTGRENAKSYQAFGYLSPSERTFGNMFRDAGYATAIVGKWQLSGNGFDGRVGITPKGAGFDTAYLWQEKTFAAKGSRYWGPTLVENGKSTINEEGFGPDYQSRFALDFIEKNKDRPFFLYYPMVLAHSPFVATPDSLTAEGAKNKFGGMVAYMDKLVGDLLDKLKATGLDKNTVVIFTGDNGTNRQITSMRNGFPVEGGKGLSTISGTHVPMVVSWPDHYAAGETRDALFDFEDVLPTITDIAGIPTHSSGIDGVSQRPVIEGRKDHARDWIFMHYAPVWISEPARFVFDAHWKLYGDGRFVAIDPVRSTETPVPSTGASREARARKAAFQKLLATIGDGPLDQDRYPMCKGRPSLDPNRPAIRAGCPGLRDVSE